MMVTTFWLILTGIFRLSQTHGIQYIFFPIFSIKKKEKKEVYIWERGAGCTNFVTTRRRFMFHPA